MLVPLDGSETAEVVFTYVKELAVRLDMDVVLLQVGPSEFRAFAPMQQAYIERAADAVTRQVKAVQKRLSTKTGKKQISVTGTLATGHAADEILRYAEENAIDLIVMATHGRSGLGRWVLGSVADRVLRASKAPIWLVRAGVTEETPYDKWPRMTILAPLNGSELAESALPHVEALAKQRGTQPVEVVILRVCEPPNPPAYYAPEISGVSVNWGEYLQQEAAWRKKTADEYIAKIEEQLKEHKINVRSEVLEGKAIDTIVSYAKESPFTVIVMATHGRAGFHRWVYGSIAEHVVLQVSNPVLLIGPHEAEKSKGE